MMKCELCNSKAGEINSCQNCETNYCPACGDSERELCNDCINFNEVINNDVEAYEG